MKHKAIPSEACMICAICYNGFTVLESGGIMQEIWKDVQGYEGQYQVSNLGRVKSIKRKLTNGRSVSEKILNSSSKKKTQDGYLMVALAGRTFRVNRLVAAAFIPNPDNKPVVNHIDGNKENNKADNLEWATISENMLHAYRCGLKTAMIGEENPNAKLTRNQVKAIRSEYVPYSQQYGSNALAKKYNVSNVTITNIVNHKTYKNV